MRVAVFGGSFNPPHLGHQVLCLMLLETCPIDEVWLVPTYKHYFGKTLVDFTQRVQLCEKLVTPFAGRAKVCTVEQELAATAGDSHKSRMLDTLEALSETHPQTQFRLVIGADILEETHKWYRWDDVARLAPPLVFQRHGFVGGTLPAPPDISSRAIRSQLACGEPVSDVLPKQVLHLVEKEGLYQ